MAKHSAASIKNIYATFCLQAYSTRAQALAFSYISVKHFLL